MINRKSDWQRYFRDVRTARRVSDDFESVWNGVPSHGLTDRAKEFAFGHTVWPDYNEPGHGILELLTCETIPDKRLRKAMSYLRSYKDSNKYSERFAERLPR